MDKEKSNDNVPFDPISFSMSIQKHDTALEALKNVPEMLAQLAQAVGIGKNPEPTNNHQSWDLGLSDNDEENDEDKDINKLIGKDDVENSSIVIGKKPQFKILFL
jgi:hypothetical protein